MPKLFAYCTQCRYYAPDVTQVVVIIENGKTFAEYECALSEEFYWPEILSYYYAGALCPYFCQKTCGGCG